MHPSRNIRISLTLISLPQLLQAEKPAAPSAGQQVAQHIQIKKAEGSPSNLNFWLYLPKTFTAGAAEKFPLILFLHGSGERGTELSAVKKHGPPSLIGENPQLDSCIIISPQCPANQWWNVADLKALCDGVEQQYPVDAQRRYVTGLSMGGFGTWEILAAYPDFWAAGVPICGGGKPTLAKKFKHIPIWAFHGGKDPAVPIRASEDMITALKAAGGDPQYTIYPDEGHLSWVPAYKDPALWKWLLEQRKPPP